MKEILSDQLQNLEPVACGNQTGMLDLYDSLQTPVTNDVIMLSIRHQRQIEQFVQLAAASYTPEPTLAYDQFGLPALVTRVDCTIDAEGNIAPYEMEDSPSGQGITDVIHRAGGRPGIRNSILDHYEDMVGASPTVIVSNERNHGTDDKLIVGASRYVGLGHDPAALRVSGPVIVKAIPGIISSRLPYMSLRERALAPLETEGDKSYAEKIGLLASIGTAEELLIGTDGNLESQVVKARLGSMAMGISIYLNSADKQRFGKAGTVTASRLKRDVETYGERSEGVLLQRFIPPIQLENAEGRTNAILRIFTLLMRSNERIVARAIGGCFVARNEVLLHGASNAVSGAVLVQ